MGERSCAFKIGFVQTTISPISRNVQNETLSILQKEHRQVMLYFNFNLRLNEILMVKDATGSKTECKKTTI